MKRTMKSVAVTPSHPHAVDLIELPTPNLNSIPDERGVLVKVLQVGLCGTDRELYEGKYGNLPDGDNYLVVGHESLGKIIEVGKNVNEFTCGDYVVATVRRPGSSIYDRIGASDMTTDIDCYEHGISSLHGFLAEYYVERPDYLINIPPRLKDIAVLLEPMSVVQKGIEQTYEIQRRLKVWYPYKAAVVGIGSIGLLATLALRLRGINTFCFDVVSEQHMKAAMVREIGAHYVNTSEMPLGEAGEILGPFDAIFESSGKSTMVFKAAHTLSKNGIMVIFSLPNDDRKIEVASDQLTLEIVLGNKVVFGTVNARREHFESGVADFAQSEVKWPGWLSQLLTDPVEGLENYRDAFDRLLQAKDIIKVHIIVSTE